MLGVGRHEHHDNPEGQVGGVHSSELPPTRGRRENRGPQLGESHRRSHGQLRAGAIEGRP